MGLSRGKDNKQSIKFWIKGSWGKGLEILSFRKAWKRYSWASWRVQRRKALHGYWRLTSHLRPQRKRTVNGADGFGGCRKRRVLRRAASRKTSFNGSKLSAHRPTHMACRNKSSNWARHLPWTRLCLRARWLGIWSFEVKFFCFLDHAFWYVWWGSECDCFVRFWMAMAQ